MKSNFGLWSVLCLTLVAVLAPTVCILYFMNEAINNQREVSNQKLAEAYRGELRNLQQRLDSFWEARAAALDCPANLPAPASFERAVETHLADAVICLGADRRPAYPSLSATPRADPTANSADWQRGRELESAGKLAEAASVYASIADHVANVDLAGRALQAQIRCAHRLHSSAELSLLEKSQTARFAAARDLEGRLISADELLLMLRVLPADSSTPLKNSDSGLQLNLRMLTASPARLKAAQRLAALAANYKDTIIPAAQRLFLMEELRTLASAMATSFPTYDAENLAARYLETGPIAASDSVLRRGDALEIWKIASRDGRAIALYKDQTMNTLMGTALQQAVESASPLTDVTFGISSPGSSAWHALTLGGGAHMPGWQVTLDIQPSAESHVLAARQRASYVWIGILVIAALSVTAIVAARLVLRQMKLARLKTDLVAAVSHELKTPLAAISLLVDTLLESDVDDPVRSREYLELISQENARLTRLISNFLTFSRMERRRAQFDFVRTGARAVIDPAVASIGDRFPVEVDAAVDLPPLYADEGALVTVLLNLLDNAFKYSAEPRRIQLSAYSEGGRCCFAVADNGIGIAAREQKRIFRRFYRVDRRMTSYAGGVGLGLSIVDFIVKAHGGTVRVESRPGQGSRFIVSLPFMASAEGAAA